MKRLLSFCALLMLFALSMNAVPLSKSLYTGSCELHLGAPLGAGATIYGNGAVPASDYADLGAYSKLVIKTSGGGLRLLFNRVGNSGSNYLEISRDANQQYFSWDGVALTIDLDAIKASTGNAHLNVIKNMYGLGDITVNSMTLLTANEVAYEKTWDFTTSDNYGGLGVSYPTGYPESYVYVEGTGYENQNARDLVITIPKVAYGNVVTITLINNGGHNSNKSWSITGTGIESQSGNGANAAGVKTVTIPSTVTTPTDLTLTLKGYSASDWIGVAKIEVTKTPTNIYYNNVKFGNDNTSYQGAWRNGAHTIGVDLAIAGNTIRFEMRDGNGATLDMAALTEGNTANIANYFSFTSSDNSVIDASNATFEVSGNSVYVRNVSFLKWGEATVTLAYNGSNGFFDSSKSTVVTVTGNQRYIGFSGEATSVTEGYIDEADFRQFVRLYTNEARTGGAYYDTNVGFVVTADTSKVISIGNTYATNNRRFDVWTKPLSVGVSTVHVVYPGDATQLPCEWDYDVTIKKHNTKLTFSRDNATVNYSNDGASINASDLPTLTKWMDEDGKTVTYTVKYTSSNPSVASVDENTGAVTMHNSGVTHIIATVVTTKTINGVVVEAYTSDQDSYVLTVQGSNNQSGVLVWLSQINPETGSPLGGKNRGSYWTQKNIQHYTVNSGSNQTLFNPGKETSDSINLVTVLPYGNEIVVSASFFNNMDWLQPDANGVYQGTWADIKNGYGVIPYSNHFFKLKDDTYFTGNEEGPKMRDGKRYNWRYNQIGTTPSDYNGMGDNNYRSEAYKQYIPAAAQPQTWSYVQRNGQTVTYNNVWMSNIEYSISDPNLLDAYSEGVRIQSGGSEGQCWVKEYSIRPYPAMDDEGNVTGDSITIYATIPGGGNTNPITISHKVLVVKGHYNLTTEPKEGYVTVGEWVIPYVNIPDIKLKDIKKITVWFDDPTVGKIECEITTNENGQVIYTLYEKDVTSSEWIGTHKDDDSKLTLVDRIFPKITGLKENWSTTMHIKVESPFYEDQECEYILHVLPDADHPKFHWYANDDGETNGKPNSCVMGRDKGVNGPRTIHFGEDDGVIKEMVIYEGDLVHMPGIVGTPNGNDEYSVEGNWSDRMQSNPEPGYKYLYGIYQGKVERNANSYYWREGVPNYFFTQGYSKEGNVYTPQGDPMIPTNHAVSNNPAFIIKSIAEWGQRGDTLMIYGNKAGSVYLWAQDPQTHLCCTPIHLTVKARSEILNAKHTYLQNMTYPYTWDFEHMDMTNIINDRNNNGSNYWELLRVDEKYSGDQVISPDNIPYYQANGFFNADYDDKDGDQSYRQRWFKDLTTGEGYMPQFYGLMLNIAGLQYWTQKYNRFQVAADGSHIYFVGGPHYLQLPGFGIKPEGTYNTPENYDYDKMEYDGARNWKGKYAKYEEDQYDKQGNLIHREGDVIHYHSKDGTRQNDNVMGGWHSHVNTINNSFVEGYGYTSNPDVANATAFDGVNAGTDQAVHNRKVRFVIVASGNGSKGAESSQFHIGGKSMIDMALDENAINWSYSTNDSKRKGTDGQNYHGVNKDSQTEDNYGNENIPGYSKYNLSKNRTLYAFDLDPYDPEYQDHIYLMFNNDVKVYWMGISTEPRDMRSDYDNFTFSYPKDIDLDKTNDLMYTATSDGVRSKTAVDGTRSVPHHNKVDEGGNANGIQFQAFYASGYNRAKESLILERFPDNRIPAGEGALVYPFVGSKAGYGNSHTFVNDQISTKYNQSGTAGMEQITPANRTVVTFLGFRTETVVKDGKTYNIQVPIYGQKTVKYQYQYLPTYFIANAQNVKDYDSEHGTKTDSKYEFGYQYGHVTPLSAGAAPSAEPKDGVVANKSTNLLRGSVYTTYIPKDYTDGNNVRWINLGLTNEYIARTLSPEDHKTLLGQVVDDASGNQMSLDTYYELIGPKFVRFYRANKDQNMKNRRAYLTLTWDEYNVWTDGKRGVSYQEIIGGEDPEMFYGYYGTDESLWEDPNSTNSPQRYYGVMLAFGNNGNNNDTVVSEGDGLVDGISEVQSAGNDDVEFYNLNGVRVNTPRKGLYIMNGKKVIVK